MGWIDRCTTGAAKLLMWVGCLAVILMAASIGWLGGIVFRRD